MPTYTYKCTNKDCESRFEKFQANDAESVQPCPKCKHISRRTIEEIGGIAFKGSGFYVNDYGNKKG